MFHFRKLTYLEFYCMGIRFKSKTEADAFVALMQKEYESRIKEAITRDRSEEELALLEACITEEETNAWLKTYCPSYEMIIRKIDFQLEKELLQNKNKIPGVVSSSKQADSRTDYMTPAERSDLSAKAFPIASEGYHPDDVRHFLETLTVDTKNNPIDLHTLRMIENAEFRIIEQGYNMMAVDYYLDGLYDSLKRLINENTPFM